MQDFTTTQNTIINAQKEYTLAAELKQRAQALEIQGMEEAASTLTEAAATLMVPASIKIFDAGLAKYAGPLAEAVNEGPEAVKKVTGEMISAELIGPTGQGGPVKK